MGRWQPIVIGVGFFIILGFALYVFKPPLPESATGSRQPLPTPITPKPTPELSAELLRLLEDEPQTATSEDAFLFYESLEDVTDTYGY